MAAPAQDTKVSFSAQRLFTSLNPSECPVTIVGKLANLKKIQYADIANKFAPIDEKVQKSQRHFIFATGSFKNYVDQFLSYFDHLPTYSGLSWTFGALPTLCPRGHRKKPLPLSI